MDPLRIQFLDTIHYPQHGLLRGEDAGLAIALAHLLTQVLSHDGGLVAPLYVEVRGKEAAARFLEDHHRVPVVHVRRFYETQLMLSKVYNLAVPEPLHGARVVPLR